MYCQYLSRRFPEFYFCDPQQLFSFPVYILLYIKLSHINHAYVNTALKTHKLKSWSHAAYVALLGKRSSFLIIDMHIQYRIQATDCTTENFGFDSRWKTRYLSDVQDTERIWGWLSPLVLRLKVAEAWNCAFSSIYFGGLGCVNPRLLCLPVVVICNAYW